MTERGGRGPGGEGPAGAGGDRGEAPSGEAPSRAERFRARIRELEERLEATDDPAERRGLRRDVEHLRAGLRVVEGSGGGS